MIIILPNDVSSDVWIGVDGNGRDGGGSGRDKVEEKIFP